MNIDSLRTASAIHGNLAVLHTGLRTAVHEALRLLPGAMGPNEYSVLRYMVRSGQGLSVLAISAYLAITRAQARQVVARLADGGFIESVPEPGDRRLKVWRPTDAGAELSILVPASMPAELPLHRPIAGMDLSTHAQLAAQLVHIITQMESSDGEVGVGTSLLERGQSDAGEHDFGRMFDLWLLAARAYRRIRSEQTRFLLKSTDQLVDAASYMTLYRVHERPSGMTEIAAYLRVDQNTATRLVARLSQAGLLHRAPAASNRREITVSVTPQGARVLQTVPPLNPHGAFLDAVGRLPQSGAWLSSVLQGLVSAHAGEPVLDPPMFRELMVRVIENAKDSPEKALVELPFRQAMAQFMTGVAVVTVMDDDGPRAITVNSLTSVSLSPPMLLVCFDRRSRALKALMSRKSFGVSILSSEQQALAARFGRKEASDNPHTLEDGICHQVDSVPLITGALAQIICDMAQSLEAGSHTVVFGTPRQVEITSQTQPSALGYWRSGYVHVDNEAARASA
ncbi:MAG: flavin reductase [Burkholderiaceae bacterium]|nr:flavin reductase [Burkholderiaceae bacterium]